MNIHTTDKLLDLVGTHSDRSDRKRLSADVDSESNGRGGRWLVRVAMVAGLMGVSALSAVVTKDLMAEQGGVAARALAEVTGLGGAGVADDEPRTNVDKPRVVAAGEIDALDLSGLDAGATGVAAVRAVVGNAVGMNNDDVAVGSASAGRIELLGLSPLDTSGGEGKGPRVRGFEGSREEGAKSGGGREWPSDTRWFNGRPVRPARTMTMVVTAYSPDARSCGDSADGITASLHHVETNAGKMVAADPRVLALGSMISVPGYDKGQIVPVLDKGGAIKGARLDVLFATHEAARQWGVKRLRVVVWEYADGGGKSDWRRVRDSK